MDSARINGSFFQPSPMGEGLVNEWKITYRFRRSHQETAYSTKPSSSAGCVGISADRQKGLLLLEAFQQVV
jgi:hypothetical protein